MKKVLLTQKEFDQIPHEEYIVLVRAIALRQSLNKGWNALVARMIRILGMPDNAASSWEKVDFVLMSDDTTYRPETIFRN
jgi:hypothetical protein